MTTFLRIGLETWCGLTSDVASYVYRLVLYDRAPCLRYPSLWHTIELLNSEYPCDFPQYQPTYNTERRYFTFVKTQPLRSRQRVIDRKQQPAFFCGDLVMYCGQRMRVAQLVHSTIRPTPLPYHYYLSYHRFHECRRKSCHVFDGLESGHSTFPHEHCVAGTRLEHPVHEHTLRLVQRSGMHNILSYTGQCAIHPPMWRSPSPPQIRLADLF